MRRHLRTLLIGLVTVFLLAWFFRQANFNEVWREIRAASPGPLIFSLLAMAVVYVIRAQRWCFLLQPIGPASFREAFRTTVIGFAANTVLPARAGEVVRPYLLARREGFSFSATFATIILERLLDLVSVVFLFGGFVVLFDPGVGTTNPAHYQAIKIGAMAAALGAVAALLMVTFLAGQPTRLSGPVDRAARWLPARISGRVVRMAHTFAEGLAVMRDPGRLARALVLSLGLWLAIAASIWFATVAFHMTIPFTGSFLIVALLVVGVSAPTPGAVGGFHEAFRFGATAFYGIDNDRAVGAAIVLHAVQYVPVTLLGGWFMVEEGLNLGGVKRLGQEARELEQHEEGGHDGSAATFSAREGKALG